MSVHNNQLFRAASTGDFYAAERAIYMGADVNYIAENGGNTVLIEAVYVGGNADVVKLLLRKGARIDDQNGGGTHATALMCAAYKGDCALVEILLRAGANIHLRTAGGGDTAESFASRLHHTAVIDLLHKAPSAEEVVFSSRFRGMHLEEIFNFKSLERISLLRKQTGGDVCAMTREQFSVLESSPDLRKAFEEHKKWGGKRTEEEVFPNLPLKPVKNLKL